MGTEREAEAGGRSWRTPADQREEGGSVKAGGRGMASSGSFSSLTAAQCHSNIVLTLLRNTPVPSNTQPITLCLTPRLEPGPGESPAQLWPW